MKIQTWRITKEKDVEKSVETFHSNLFISLFSGAYGVVLKCRHKVKSVSF